MRAGVTIGFNEVNYTVGENDGQVRIDIKVRNGTLHRKLIIHLSTNNQTAYGKLMSEVDIEFDTLL